jgi:hypothetical protein
MIDKKSNAVTAKAIHIVYMININTFVGHVTGHHIVSTDNEKLDAPCVVVSLYVNIKK